MSLYPIYIPTKGRPDKCHTAQNFQKYQIPFKLVVEPQDLESYREHYSDFCLVALDRNDQGIAYARNFIKKLSQSNKDAYHWQIDDNIRHIKEQIDGKYVSINPSVGFDKIQTHVEHFTNIGAAGMAHLAFAFSHEDDIEINKQVYSSVLFKNDNDLEWRSGCIEDTDYSVQLLMEGYCTLLFTRIGIDKVNSLSMSGGNTDSEYASEGRLIRAKGLQSNWPGMFNIVHRFGKISIKPKPFWKKFKQRPLKVGQKERIKEGLFFNERY
jgi:hypothetical protein